MTQGYVEENKRYWNGMAHSWVAGGEKLWALDVPTWGVWNNSETDVRLLPEDMTGMDAVELGCGTGYVAGWMTRLGAKVTAIDVSDKQLATARRLAAEHGAEITFIEGNAEATGLPDAAFDFAISEYGAAIWCDPDVWLREAWRILRPGGRLTFLGNHPLTLVCTPENGAPAEAVLHRPYRDLTGVDWREVEIEPGGVEFNRTMSGWMSLFREIGFEVLEYQELYPRPGYGDGDVHVPREWSEKFPSEQVWSLRKP